MSDDMAANVTSKKRTIEQIKHESDRQKNEPDSTPHNHDYSGNLFTLRSTLDCAINEKCITCAYKIGCFDVALDKEFTRLVPNKRPETCPRYYYSQSHNNHSCRGGSNLETTGARHMYKRGMNILTVGDGDFGFSLFLARMLNEKGNDDDDGDSPGRLITTSYESYQTLCDIYPDISSTIDELEELGAKIIYNVDGTRLEQSLDSSEQKFHRIAWNFPCKAVARGRDGQNDAMEENKNLVRRFLSSAEAFLMPKEGEIHVTHKTKPPFNQWKLEDLRVANVRFKGRLTFDVCCFPGYRPRKALDKKSFTCHDARIFVFRSKKKKKKREGREEGGAKSRFTYSIPKSSTSDSSSNTVVCVTEKLISTIRSTHISCADRKQGFTKCNYRHDTKKKGRYK